MIKAVPGDPVEVLLGAAEKDVAPEQVLAMRKELELDQPVTKQYTAWIGHVVRGGDFGRSYRDGRPAILVIEERLPATLLLVGSALIGAFTFGISWGLAMVWLQSHGAWFLKLLDTALAGFAIILYSAPSFWVGFLAIALISKFEIFSFMPVLGLHEPGQTTGNLLELARYAILPALVLASRRTAKVALFVRSTTVEEISKGYVAVARSKGLSNLTVLIHHVTRNSLLPVVTLFALSLPTLLGGSVLVETVFGWPGMGRLAVDATFGRNYPVLLALIMIYGVLVVVSNLIADIVQLYLDPRLRDSALAGNAMLRGHS